jgi:hypothetical protein
MTASTLPLLVLIAFLWWRTKGELLPIVLFTSIFDAASALNVAGAPVTPWLFALIICLPIKALSGKLSLRPVPGLNRAAFRSLLLFVGYALFSSVVFPFLFHGILVSNSRNGLNVHLAWSMTNFTQPTYLLAALAVFLLSIHSTREQLRNAVNWYIRACVCIACFSMYQLANATLHVPYPSAILYTNTAHTIYDAYKISGVWRLNSTLTEASEAAFYLGTGLALLGWHLATHRIRWQSAASFLLILTALVLTVSTVGYACLGTIAIGGILLYARYSFRRQSMAPVKLLLLLGLVGTAVPLLILTDAGHTISNVLANVFVNKVDSASYRERSLWNTLALKTSHDSYYFGAGWGSVRASSFACSLMANVGIPGVLLFLFFILQLLRPLWTPKRYARFEMYERSLFAIAVVLVALLIATPDPIEPIIWVLFAIATASKPRRMARTAQSPAQAGIPVDRPTLIPQM